MANGHSQHQFLTIKEAAGIIRMTPRFLTKMIRKKSGPKIVKFGRALRIPIEEFEKWCRNGTKGK